MRRYHAGGARRAGTILGASLAYLELVLFHQWRARAGRQLGRAARRAAAGHLFLSQSPDDQAVPLHVTPATAMLMETVQHVSRSMTRHLAEDKVQALYREQLAAGVSWPR